MRLTAQLIAMTLVAVATGAQADERIEAALALTVSEDGAIRVPAVDFRAEWTALGTWVVNGGDVVDDVSGAQGLHVTYTQPGVVTHYREHGAFPDGAVLVKELLGAGTQLMTTGVISHPGSLQGWFVMVKDTKGRFTETPNAGLWGDGWGWAYFDATDPHETTTQDYAAECLGCHVPAEETDWVYVWGYPVLGGPSVAD